MNQDPPVSHSPIRRSRVKRLARVGGFLLVIWLVVSWAVAFLLTHRLAGPINEPVPTVEWTRFEAKRFRTTDGIEIGAWYGPGADEAAPSVLLIHGNKGQRRNMLGRAESLVRAGCSVLLISLRAHGDSTGGYNDIGFSARRDVIAAVSFFERRRPHRPIVILGTSLGAAAALFAAKELGHRVAGYILESPYRDLKQAVWNRLENELPPLLDWIAYRGLLVVSPLILPEIDKISPFSAIKDVPPDVPILILAGDADISARRDEAQALYDQVRSHGELLIFPEAGHLQMMEKDPDRYRRAIGKLFDQVRTFKRGSPGGSVGRNE